MEYRVIDRSANELVETFDSAYDAVDFVTSVWYRSEARAINLFIVDSEGSVLFGPFDLGSVALAMEAA